MAELVAKNDPDVTTITTEELTASRIHLEEQLQRAPEVILVILLNRSSSGVTSIGQITGDKTLYHDLGISTLEDLDIQYDIEEALGLEEFVLAEASIANKNLRKPYITVAWLTDFVISELKAKLQNVTDQQ